MNEGFKTLAKSVLELKDEIGALTLVVHALIRAEEARAPGFKDKTLAEIDATLGKLGTEIIPAAQGATTRAFVLRTLMAGDLTSEAPRFDR